MYGEATAGFTRPDNTTAYQDNDLVANDTTAANVVPMEFDLSGAGGHIVAITITKTDESDVSNADFSLRLFGSQPTVTNGDNGAIAHDWADHIATVDVGAMVAHADRAKVTILKGETNFVAGLYTAKRKVWGLLEANAAYGPAAEEEFSVTLTYEF